MPCYKPMVRYEEGGKAKIYNINKLLDAHDQESIMYELRKLGHSPTRVDIIPCGKCIGCQLDYSRQWANRIALEMQGKECWFLTLTYADEHLPLKQQVSTLTGELMSTPTLQKSDLQKFIKRLRETWSRKYKNNDIKFFACGEYGTQGGRPHYHMILINFHAEGNAKLIKHSVNAQKQPLYKCPDIEKIWRKGHIILGRASWETAAYVARYVMKKSGKNKAYYDAKKILEPYIVASQGLGKKYYEEHKESILKYDTIPTIHGPMTPPRYFDKMTRETNPTEYERNKEIRKLAAETAANNKARQTSMSYIEQLNTAEYKKLNSAKALKRN